MKINKFILAAGVIGVVVGVLRLALVFVNTIPSPQQFPKLVWLVWLPCLSSFTSITPGSHSARAALSNATSRLRSQFSQSVSL